MMLRRHRVVAWRVEQFWEIDASHLDSAVPALTAAGFAFDIGKDVDPYSGGPLVEVSSDCPAPTAEDAITIEFQRASQVLLIDARVPASFKFASAMPTR